MSWLLRGLTYCQQLASRTAQNCVPNNQTRLQSVLRCSGAASVTQNQPVRHCSSDPLKSPDSLAPPYKFKVRSPYRNPGPRRYGYQQQLYDGGPLPRGLSEPVQSLKKYNPRNNWTKRKALFGRNDYIDILGDSELKPVDLLKAPNWLRGFNGNEMQRIIRRMNHEGHILKQLYPTFHHQQQKRLKFLYKKYNQKRGKRH